MKIEFTKAEIEIIVQLMDFGVKAVGLQAVKTEVIQVIQKFSAAVQEAEKPSKGE